MPARCQSSWTIKSNVVMISHDLKTMIQSSNVSFSSFKKSFSSNSAPNYGKKPSFISQSAWSNFALYVIN
jgi:hypothetical protein